MFGIAKLVSFDKKAEAWLVAVEIRFLPIDLETSRWLKNTKARII